MDLNGKHFGGSSCRSIKFMMDLIAERDYKAMEAEMPEKWRSLFNVIINMAYVDQDGHRTTSAIVAQNDVSKFIDQLKKCPKGTATQSKPIGNPVTEAGMYKVGDTIYKVQQAVHGSGKLYAKKLQISRNAYEGAHEVWFDYAPGAMKLIHAEDKLTYEDAKAFGAMYGTCCCCGRTLTNELSIVLGIGPVCGKRQFGGEFKFKIAEAKLAVAPN